MSDHRFEYQCVCGDGRRMTVDSEGGDVWIKTVDPDDIGMGIASGVMLTDPVEVEALRDQLNEWLLRNK